MSKKIEKKEKKENPNAKWYVLNIRTGYENSVQKEIMQRATATGMQDKIVDMLVPIQKKIVVKKGKQDVKEEKIFPGYVLIKMELDNATWDLVQNTERNKSVRFGQSLEQIQIRCFMNVLKKRYLI